LSHLTGSSRETARAVPAADAESPDKMIPPAGQIRRAAVQKAKENNLLTKPENEMTDKEIYSMIFLPGFSTKENITEFSGRGVGMDVVVKNIETLGGRVFVDSKEGFGTQTTIRFPLTLAIINGMNVKVGESKYTIPITAVRELIKPKEVDIITDPDRNEMIMYRGKCYSIVRLNKFYDISTELKKFDDGMLIMAEDGDRMIGLFADELIGENQVVIKPLPKYIKKIDGVAGCTILGDGSISLILDVGGLISANQFVS
jgi:two-component system chemotaxis sensor kinase CheA